MRKVIEPQMIFGVVDISKIEFDLKSHDEIPNINFVLKFKRQ